VLLGEETVNLRYGKQPLGIALFVRAEAALEVYDDALVTDGAVFVLGEVNVSEKVNDSLVFANQSGLVFGPAGSNNRHELVKQVAAHGLGRLWF
jgi:hypothetical protein